MLKQLSKVNGAKNLTKDAQKDINGGRHLPIELKRCGGDGSFIIQNGVMVCCFVGFPNLYIC